MKNLYKKIDSIEEEEAEIGEKYGQKRVEVIKLKL